MVSQKGHSDIIIMNYHIYWKGLALKFKNPNNNDQISDAQNKMKKDV